MKLINLLPKPRQRELRYEAIYRSLKTVVIWGFLSFAVVFFSQFLTKIYLQVKISSINAEIEQLKKQVNKQENADLKKKIQSINSIIGDFNMLATSAPKWSKVVKAFAELPPEDVKISSFTVSADKKQVSINGYAPNRQAVIQLYNNILADKKNFSNIDYPLENVARAVDINFHFTFTVQDQLLK